MSHDVMSAGSTTCSFLVQSEMCPLELLTATGRFNKYHLLFSNYISRL